MANAMTAPAAPAPSHVRCRWCHIPYRAGEGFGAFCSRPCADAEVRGDRQPAPRLRAEQVQQDIKTVLGAEVRNVPLRAMRQRREDS